MINLIIKNLHGFIKNKVVFCLFILGMAASLTIALYIYSVFASMNAQGYDAQGTYQVATIDLTGQTKESVQRSLSALSQKRDDMDMIFTMFTEQGQLILASYTRTPFQYAGISRNRILRPVLLWSSPPPLFMTSITRLSTCRSAGKTTAFWRFPTVPFQKCRSTR